MLASFILPVIFSPLFRIVAIAVLCLGIGFFKGWSSGDPARQEVEQLRAAALERARIEEMDRGRAAVEEARIKGIENENQRLIAEIGAASCTLTASELDSLRKLAAR